MDIMINVYRKSEAFTSEFLKSLEEMFSHSWLFQNENNKQYNHTVNEYNQYTDGPDRINANRLACYKDYAADSNLNVVPTI